MAVGQPPPGSSENRVDLVAEQSTAGPEAGQRRRTGKGHVSSYGLDRICAAPGCETHLSRYNAAPTCWRHRDYRVGFTERWSR